MQCFHCKQYCYFQLQVDRRAGLVFAAVSQPMQRGLAAALETAHMTVLSWGTGRLGIPQQVDLCKQLKPANRAPAAGVLRRPAPPSPLQAPASASLLRRSHLSP